MEQLVLKTACRSNNQFTTTMLVVMVLIIIINVMVFELMSHTHPILSLCGFLPTSLSVK